MHTAISKASNLAGAVALTLALALSVGAALFAGASAHADDLGGESIVVSQGEGTSSEQSDRDSAYAAIPEGPQVIWTEGDRYRYGTDYLFPLTRNMNESGLHLGWQIALYPLAFVIDVGQFPAGLFGGLYGS